MASLETRSENAYIKLEESVFAGNIKDYDATYAIPKKILRGIGLRIMANDTSIASICWNAFFWFNFTNVAIATAAESVNMFQMAAVGTLLELFTMMPCLGYLVVSASKAYKIKRYKFVYENLISELRDMWPSGNITEDQFNIVNEGQRRLRFVVKVYFICNIILGSIFTVPSYISWIKHRTGYDIPLLLPFFYWLPYDPFIGNRFEITLVLQTCHCFLSTFFMISGDLLFCIFLNHITTQFSLLANRISKLILVPVDDQLIKSYPLGAYSNLHNENEFDDNETNEGEKEKKLNEELVAIIHRHRALIRLSSDVEDMYTFSLLVNFLNSSIIICFSLFCCAFFEKWNEVQYKMFCLTAILQIWILCWYGQKLLDTSAGVAEALLNCGWYIASNKIKKSILIMIHRSQKHVYVTTYGFSIISLESYATILKTSWSYFTLLINMYKE